MTSNPYILLPVNRNNPDMFYGYQHELEQIVSRVTAARRYSYAVVGGSRMGKTSLLRQIERRLLTIQNEYANIDQPIVIPLFLDMLQLGDITLNEFLGRVARLLSRSVAHASLSMPEEVKTLLQSVKTNQEPLEIFAEALFKLTQATAPRQLRIVILIDDLWRIKRQKLEVITALRALYMESSLDEVVAYVITGSYSEIDSAGEWDSPFHNILVMKELHVFDREQSLALINKPTHEQITAEVAEHVYTETGGHPYLLQCLMSELCEHENLTRLTVEDVDQAAVHRLKERRDFERWWEKLGEAERKVYGATCQHEQVSADDLRRMMLNIPVEGGRSVIMTVPMIRKSLRVLSTAGLIRELGGWDNEELYEVAGEWHKHWFMQTNKSTQSLA